MRGRFNLDKWVSRDYGGEETAGCYGWVRRKV